MHKEEFRNRLKKVGKKTGVCLFKLTCWVACAPCLCCALVFLPRRRRRGCVIGTCGHEHGNWEPTVPELPAPRRRAMSLPLIHAQEGQNTLDQSQSDFLIKLPLEIRRMVYEEALGNAPVHFINVHGIAFAKRCGKSECRCSYFDPTEEKALDFGLGLLRTCRQIYSEAVEYLYTSNSFSISTEKDEVPTIDYIGHYIIPERLSQIRRLRIHWELDSHPYDFITQFRQPVFTPWVTSWNALSRLTGLRHLHVDLVFRYSHWADYYEELWKDKGEKVLEVVKKITIPRDFVVVLPHRRCSLDVDVGESKCVLKLPGRDSQTTD